MVYKSLGLPLERLLPGLGQAEDQLARLDERVRLSPVGPGFAARADFLDTAASMWIAGELVHVEDLVLHDAHMDARTPTHELTLAHTILRARRRIMREAPDWALSPTGMAALISGAGDDGLQMTAPERRAEEEAILPDLVDPLAEALSEVEAVLARTQRLVAGQGAEPLSVGELVIRDADWNRSERLAEWQQMKAEADALPPTLGAALLWDGWETLAPLERQHWLGPLLISAYLRGRGKVTSHLLGLNMGLKPIPRDRRRSADRTMRLLAFLEALSGAAETGLEALARLNQAKAQMERRLTQRRRSSSLPQVIELLLARPIVSAGMVAAAVNITPRGALNLIGELGVREMTGRGRYRGWGVG